jgi:hypothetical protein
MRLIKPAILASLCALALAVPAASAQAALTVKGKPITAVQLWVAWQLLEGGAPLHANHVANTAVLYAAMGETSLGASASTWTQHGSPCFDGVLQGSCRYFPNPYDIYSQGQAFFAGTKSFAAGGAVALSRRTSNPEEIAVRVEVPSIWPRDAYAAEWPGGAKQGIAEASAIASALGF